MAGLRGGGGEGGAVTGPGLGVSELVSHLMLHLHEDCRRPFRPGSVWDGQLLKVGLAGGAGLRGEGGSRESTDAAASFPEHRS